MPRILVLHGPNLNMLGTREPEIYGYTTLDDINTMIAARAAEAGIETAFYQSNHEGDLIDWVQEFGGLKTSLHAEPVDGIILNAGGYTHTSVALRDAVACAMVPVVEVHISDISQREEFRHVSLLSDVCTHTVMGHGTDGYREALEWIINSKG